MQHNLINLPLPALGIALTPIITDGVGKDVAIPVEAGGADGAADFRVALEAVLGVLVPEVEGAVAAGGAEGAVDRVEGDGVYGVDVRDVARLGGGLPVAFKGEVRAGGRVLVGGAFSWDGWMSGGLGGGGRLGLPGVFFFNVLDCASAFYAADRETGGVAEAADHSCLPLQRALHRFVEFGRGVQAYDVDDSVRRRDHQELVLHIHAVDFVLTLHARDRCRLPQIPVFDRLVP